MSTQASRTFNTTGGPLQAVAAVAQALYVNLVAVVDVIVRHRTVTDNVQHMAQLLKEAQRVEARSPARAAQLRAQARRLELA